MKDNQTTVVLFAGVNVTRFAQKMIDSGNSHPDRTIEMNIASDIEGLKILGNNQKVKDAYETYKALLLLEDEYQENDICTYREVNFNIQRNYRNLVIEEMVEAMDAWNEFIDFPEFQLGVINMSYEFDIDSDDLK